MWKAQDYYKNKKKKKEPKYYLIVVFVVLATMVVFVSLIRPDLEVVSTGDCDIKNASPAEYKVKLYEKSELEFDIEYAKTPTQQELGLSDRPCLPKNMAILFLFAQDDKFGIWMKNMRFPIDVVWLDKDKKIISIEKGMKPESYPKVYYPSTDARYVLEFNTGTVDALKASVGSQFNW